jgi:hypothetical protein
MLAGTLRSHASDHVERRPTLINPMTLKGPSNLKGPSRTATRPSVFRGLLRLLLRGPVIGAMVAIGVLALVIAADEYHWGWTVIPVHYRVSFAVEVGGIDYTGASVVQVTYEQAPIWQPWVKLGASGGAIYQGQAATLRLPDGKVLCMMTNGQIVVGKKTRSSVVVIANRLFPPSLDTGGRLDVIDTYDAAHISGNMDIPLDLLPPIVLFESAADPRSAHLFDPQRADLWLGIGASFLGARIAVTSEPQTTGIATVLPWLANDALLEPLTGVNDPFHHESGGSFLFKAYFY